MADVQDLLKARYYHPGENSWEELCARVAAFIHSDVAWMQLGLAKAMINKQFAIT